MVRGSNPYEPDSAARAARARAGFHTAALLQAKLFFRSEQFVTRLLGRLRAAKLPTELLAPALFLGDAALALGAGKQLALAALDRRGTFWTAVVLARGLCERRHGQQQEYGKDAQRHIGATRSTDGGSAPSGRADCSRDAKEPT